MVLTTIKLGDHITIEYDDAIHKDNKFVEQMTKKYNYRSMGRPKTEFNPDVDRLIDSIVTDLKKAKVYPSSNRVQKILKEQHNNIDYGRVILERKLKELGVKK